jgi:hypothetical protein
MELDFTTNNDAQAFALCMAGVEFSAPGVTNKYSPNKLRELGLAGMLPMDAIKSAVNAEKRGAVTYFFRTGQGCGELVAAYDDQVRILKETDCALLETISIVEARFADGQITKQERDVRMWCCFMWGRKIFVNLWKQCVPTFFVEKEGAVKRESDKETGGGSVTHPGFIEASVNCTPETLRRLGL